jgi:hypothetical protein
MCLHRSSCKISAESSSKRRSGVEKGTPELSQTDICNESEEPGTEESGR